MYNNLISIFESLKKAGISAEDAPNCLELDSDEYIDFNIIKAALVAVYGE